MFSLAWATNRQIEVWTEYKWKIITASGLSETIQISSEATEINEVKLIACQPGFLPYS